MPTTSRDNFSTDFIAEVASDVVAKVREGLARVGVGTVDSGLPNWLTLESYKKPFMYVKEEPYSPSKWISYLQIQIRALRFDGKLRMGGDRVSLRWDWWERPVYQEEQLRHIVNLLKKRHDSILDYQMERNPDVHRQAVHLQNYYLKHADGISVVNGKLRVEFGDLTMAQAKALLKARELAV
jgi:hypothetical protein